MITPEESASILLATIAPHIVIPNHPAEATISIMIRDHIEADRKACADQISQQATNLLN